MQASSNEPTLVDVIIRLDKLAEDVEKYQTRFEPTLVDVITRLDKLTEDLDKLTGDVEKYETRFEKLDNRLWTLSLALVTTAWAAIFAAAGVVIFRSVVG